MTKYMGLWGGIPIYMTEILDLDNNCENGKEMLD